MEWVFVVVGFLFRGGKWSGVVVLACLLEWLCGGADCPLDSWV